MSIGMGKIFHEGADNMDQDAAYSWSPEALTLKLNLNLKIN